FDDEFHFDDMFFIVNNADIRDIKDLSAIWKTTLSQPSRFVGFISFALNYHCHQLDVFGYHLTNFLIHIVTAVLVWWFVKMLFRILRPDFKNSEVASFFAALLFVSHPVQTQAVTYISQRFASLATFFYLTSVCFYLKARLVNQNKFASTCCFVVCAAAAVLGMFTKEITITLPLMIIFIEWFLLKDSNTVAKNKGHGKGNRLAKILPIFILPFCFIIPALFRFGFKGMFISLHASQSHSGDVLTFGTYVLTQFRVLAVFIRLLFVPLNQNLDYDFKMSHSLFDAATFLSFTLLAALLVLAVKLRRKNRLVSFGMFWFFLTLSANFIPRNHVIFEHKLYLASIGFCIAVTVWIFDVFKNKKNSFVLMGIIIVLFSFLAFQRNKIWNSEITLWEDVVAKSPNKSKPRINLGNAYFSIRDYGKALIQFEKAVKMDNQAVEAYNGLGLIYEKKGEYESAINYYNKVLEIKPNKAEAYSNRGVVYKSMGKYDLALGDQNTSIFLNPDFALSYMNRGIVYKSMGKYDLALADYRKALAIDPKLAAVYANRGVVYKKQGKNELALVNYNKALELNPNIPQVYYNRSIVYNDLGNKKNALEDILKAQAFGIKVDSKYIEWLKKR
ncbi:tetratricopeptide repeat protein, partial [bacterium]|nr:tetratricopeptide repeat protein [bacterium]